MASPQILYEDNYLMVVNKPSGWIVNSSGTTTDQPVVQKWIEEKYNFWKQADKKSDFYQRAGVVHRLDKETSGCLLVAKDEMSFSFLQSAFKQRHVSKVYLALTHGLFKEKKGSIDAALGRLPWKRERFGILAGGRSSQTNFEVKQVFTKDKESYSLVEFFPKTGRTHQIRIHAKYIGHPLVGDTFYAGRKTARKDRLWCGRLFLHAARISFPHPNTSKVISVEAPPPSDLKQALHTLS